MQIDQIPPEQGKDGGDHEEGIDQEDRNDSIVKWSNLGVSKPYVRMLVSTLATERVDFQLVASTIKTMNGFPKR